MLDLPKKLRKRPFTYRDAIEVGLTKYALVQLIKQGIVERIKRGIYIPTDYDDTNPESQLHLAALQCGTPSCICLLSALDYYHVTDQVPNKVWIMVPQQKRVRSSNLKLIRSRTPQWDIGIDKSNDYWVTTLPRTLIECLLAKHRLGSDVAISALKTSVIHKKVKLRNIISIANQMGVQKRIYPYIETLVI